MDDLRNVKWDQVSCSIDQTAAAYFPSGERLRSRIKVRKPLLAVVYPAIAPEGPLPTIITSNKFIFLSSRFVYITIIFAQ